MRDERRDSSFFAALRQIPAEIEKELELLSYQSLNSIEEVRMRSGQKIVFCCGSKKYEGSFICDKKLLNDTINSFLDYSYYAHEEELRNGYITLTGGHRAGICGKAVVENGSVRLIKDISSINLRCSKEYIGIAEKIIPTLIDREGRLQNTLIVSPPKCGKTTLLRDIVRSLSERGMNISICDERSEIAGMYCGQPSFNIGPNTDVMTGCPKGEGMLMLLRSMAPDIVVTDEIGKRQEIEAIEALLSAGIKFITTLHGGSMEELKRNNIYSLVKKGAFGRIVFLTSVPHPCTVLRILGGKANV